MLKVAGAEEDEAYTVSGKQCVSCVCVCGGGVVREKANSAECLTTAGIVPQLEECLLSKFFKGFYV